MAIDDASIVQGGRIYKVLEKMYRVRVYRPARYYLSWKFLISIVLVFCSAPIEYVGFVQGEIPGVLNMLPWFLPTFFGALVMVLFSTFDGMIASSLHMVEGDRGIYSLGSVPATAPIVTKTTFIVNTPEKQALYDPKYANARITRFLVWRWGRRGGCMNWPGKAGGKAEGFFALVVYSWEEAEYIGPDKKVVREVIEKQPCPTCNKGRATTADERGFVHVPALEAADLQAMATAWPGLKRGGVIDLRMQVMADRYLEELPDSVAAAIQADEEFRASSRIDVMYDPLPDGPSLGTVLDHNAQAQLFGLEYAMKRARKNIVDLNQEITVVSQLSGGRMLGSPGLGQSGQPPR